MPVKHASDRALQQLHAEHSDADRDLHYRVLPLRDAYVGPLRPANMLFVRCHRAAAARGGQRRAPCDAEYERRAVGTNRSVNPRSGPHAERP
jgi:hypothetical protein